jgi:hypothetical protein
MNNLARLLERQGKDQVTCSRAAQGPLERLPFPTYQAGASQATWRVGSDVRRDIASLQALGRERPTVRPQKEYLMQLNLQFYDLTKAGVNHVTQSLLKKCDMQQNSMPSADKLGSWKLFRPDMLAEEPHVCCHPLVVHEFLVRLTTSKSILPHSCCRPSELRLFPPNSCILWVLAPSLPTSLKNQPRDLIYSTAVYRRRF